MTKIIFYITVFVSLCFSKIHAQESFESQAKSISKNIENITKEEKAALKVEVEAVNIQIETGLITKEEADNKKEALAKTRANNIETRVAKEQEKIEILVQNKVDGNITVVDSAGRKTFVIPAMKVINSKDKNKKRSTSQFVLAFGANNVVVDGAVANSDFYYWQSRFFEWGFTYNTRILKNYNLLHLKYGFSVMYNNICPTDNRYFVPTTNSQTGLEVFPDELEGSRFKNVYLVAPLHLEFDFSGNKFKNGSSSFSTHKGVRFGIGGYAGFRVKSKQKMNYNIDDDKIKIKTKGNFNTNDFVYGLSTYVGYKETSLYLKYDLNLLFENNTVKQNNISLGVRFDFN